MNDHQANELLAAADAVVERWHSRDWKQPHTAEFVARLAAAVGDARRAAPTEPAVDPDAAMIMDALQDARQFAKHNLVAVSKIDAAMRAVTRSVIAAISAPAAPAVPAAKPLHQVIAEWDALPYAKAGPVPANSANNSSSSNNSNNSTAQPSGNPGELPNSPEFDGISTPPSPSVDQDIVQVELNRVYLLRGVQQFLLAYEPETDDEAQWYAGQLRKFLAASSVDQAKRLVGGEVADSERLDLLDEWILANKRLGWVEFHFAFNVERTAREQIDAAWADLASTGSATSTDGGEGVNG